MVFSAFSLFFVSYLDFQQQAQNVLILSRDTLASHQERLVDDDGVGELCRLCIPSHNNGPLLCASYAKSGEGLIGKMAFERPHIHQIDYICSASLCFLLVFVRFPVKAYINFIK